MWLLVRFLTAQPLNLFPPLGYFCSMSLGRRQNMPPTLKTKKARFWLSFFLVVKVACADDQAQPIRFLCLGQWGILSQ